MGTPYHTATDKLRRDHRKQMLAAAMARAGSTGKNRLGATPGLVGGQEAREEEQRSSKRNEDKLRNTQGWGAPEQGHRCCHGARPDAGIPGTAEAFPATSLVAPSHLPDHMWKPHL